MTNQETMTYEDYLDLIKKQLSKSLSHLSDKELADYLQCEYKQIREWYDRVLNPLTAWGITMEETWEGSVSGAVHALSLMWE